MHLNKTIAKKSGYVPRSQLVRDRVKMLDQFLVLHEHVFLSQIADVTALQFFLQSSMFSCGKYVKSSISKVFCGTKSVVKQDYYLLSEQFKCIVLLYASVSRLNRSLILV